MNIEILIVDDSKLINDAIKTLLDNRGYEVTQAFNLGDAREELIKKEFDFVLLDLVLPDGDGEEILPAIALCKKTRTMILSSDKDSYRREQLFALGVVDYVAKDTLFENVQYAIISLIDKIIANSEFTILVVDDSSFLRKHIISLVERRGFKAIGAQDGRDALHVIKKHRVDGFIIDLEMPVMDGIQLLEKLKKESTYRMLPIMVLSGSEDKDKVSYVLKRGANDYVKKPFSTEELLLKIDKMMVEYQQDLTIKAQESQFALYNKAIDTSAIFMKLDSELNILYANDMLCDLLDIEFNKIEKTPFSTLFLNTNSSAFNKKILSEGSFKDTVSLINNKIVSFTFNPIMDTNNKINECLLIGFDVTLMYEKEESLADRIDSEIRKNWEQNKLMIQQSKMASMGEMIGNISHQWRQPLNALGLIIQKLQVSYELDRLSENVMITSVKKANNIINSMSQTIDDFRNFFKTDSKKEPFLLSQSISNVVTIIGDTLKEKSITLEVSSSDAKLFGSKSELSQALLNIVSNAKDALLLNRVDNASISIDVLLEDESVLIIVDDNAGGIDENIMNKIFEPYFTTKGDGDGTGIGLYMTKMIIEKNMNGSLHVANSSHGASFEIKLPICELNE
ncbi:MAG: response regulator [Campylobacterota bacterium]|nr:response regulator [Campylobacterota bacterium]